MRRVVVTGLAGLTALGNSWPEIKANLQAGKTATSHMPEWADIDGMNTELAAPIKNTDFLKDRWTRKQTRTMGKVAQYSIYATEEALKTANLSLDPVLKSGRVGVAYGSSYGSTESVREFADLLFSNSIRKMNATSYIRMMGHTTAVNIGIFFGLTGRIIPSSTACTSGSLAIGYAMENIRSGAQDIMIAGGAEELCPSMAAVFDVLYATSTCNQTPETAPRPYDVNRDGIVIGEGACTLILEEYEHAVARGATLYAEVVGFGTNMDGNHITQPSEKTMEIALRLGLNSANLNPSAIGFISGHGTATDQGDIAESIATNAIFSDKTPIHSLKSYFGHTLGACGALESWLGIEMMRDSWFPPTANLKNIDPKCAALDYVIEKPRTLDIDYLMNNNFAFGGINTSLIFKKV